MKIVVAPDSFKGSITSLQAAKVMEKAILTIDADDRVYVKPMADGGEGTLDSLLGSTTSEKIPITCTGPVGEQIKTYYGIVQSEIAIIEGATIAGLVQVPHKQRNPDDTTSYGIGEVITDALDRGCTSFVIGIGGSATNDGGLGMLQALGMQAYDEAGNKVGMFGRDLFRVKQVNLSGLDKRLKKTSLKIACDVDNPLCGDKGATVVYGPQKGATAEQIIEYDRALDQYSAVIEAKLNQSLKYDKGAGAAGGLGFAFLAIEANIVSGAKLLAEAINMEAVIKEADLVITGEGQSDEQTLYGKAPGYIASLAKKHQVPAILISGSITGDVDALRKTFSGCFSIVNQPMTLEYCMENAQALLYEQTKQVIHLIKSIKNEE